jgi:hypothetical protein
MIVGENLDDSRSVEHMIPNTILTCSRSRRDGDFYACRKCNSEKSHIDYVLAVVAMAQSRNDALAAQALTDAVLRDANTAPAFIEMVRGAAIHPDGVSMEMPIDGRDLLDYIRFLAKGQYFKENEEVLDDFKTAILPEFVNKQVLRPLEDGYENEHESNPFSDLSSNPHTEVVLESECLIYSKNNAYIFVFHDYTALIARVVNRTAEVSHREQELCAQILRDFPRRRSTRDRVAAQQAVEPDAE